MHEHNDYSHELKHCEYCDVVYCTKCKREWRSKKYTCIVHCLGSNATELWTNAGYNIGVNVGWTAGAPTPPVDVPSVPPTCKHV